MTQYVVPEQCLYCASPGRVAMIARTHGGGVVVWWHCDDCDREWPIEHREGSNERRSGVRDRRRATRADRRRHG